MDDYEWVRRVPVNKLSNRSLVLVSRFARHLKQTNGRVLVLRSPEMPINLVKEALMADDVVLTRLLNDLLDEFFKIAESEGVAVDTYKSATSKQIDTPSSDPEVSATINH